MCGALLLLLFLLLSLIIVAFLLLGQAKGDPYILVISAKVLFSFLHNIHNRG